MVTTTNSKVHKLVWLLAVASDPRMRGLPCAVAVLLALRYFHPETGQAWPSQERLSRELSCTRQNCQRAIDRLIVAGWLSKRSGGHGRSNTYWLNIAHSSLASEAALPARLGSLASEANSGLASEALKKGKKVGKKRRGERARATPSSFSVGEKTKHDANPFPDEWSALSAAQLEIARHAAEWDEERANREFRKFRAHHRSKGTRSRNWSDSWESWCQRGREFDQKDIKQAAGRSRETGVRSAALVMREWLNERKR
jgi:hypothetical protein